MNSSLKLACSGTAEEPGSHLPSKPVPVLAWRIQQVAEALGIDPKTLHRWRLAGKFPKPDRVVNRTPLWRPGSIEAWLGGEGRSR